MDSIACPYCNQKAELIDSIYIYRYRSYGKMWICYDCKAWVGCHKGTDKPLGTMANEELRKARKLTHKQFDLIWKKKYFTRKESYQMLAELLGLSKDKCHIGMFDIETCRLSWSFSNKKIQELTNPNKRKNDFP